LNSDEATGLLQIVTDYTYALDVLDQYDHQVLEIRDTTSKELFQITYPAAITAIKGLKYKFVVGVLFSAMKRMIHLRVHSLLFTKPLVGKIFIPA
jgi:hypothetical protein